jgi:hypothetical protein
MTDDYHDRIDELLDQAEELADGEPKLLLLEEAVRLADAHQDVELGFNLREDVVRTATFSGRNEKALVAFTWRLAQADREPERFPARSLLWEYKWVVGSLTGFPQFSRRQIEEMLDDMTRRFERCGANLRAVHKLRCKVAQAMHEPEAARKHFRAWKQAPDGWPSDCAACDQDSHVRYLIFVGKDDKAVEHAGPILQGRMSCAVVPQATLGAVLRPLVRLGRVQEAVRCHQRGYRMIAGNKDFLEEAAQHLSFLVLTDNLARAVKVFEKHLGWALETMDLEDRFEYLLAARFLFERLGGSGKASLPLRLPRTFAGYQEGGRYEVPALLAWAEAECRELAARFDERNGNDGFARRMADERRLKELVRPCPLKSG